MRAKILRLFCTILTYRYLPAILAGLGMALTLPSLWKGLAIDDLIHRMMLVKPSGSGTMPNHPWVADPHANTLFLALKGLFAFTYPEINVHHMDTGVGPWWSIEALRISFFRPVGAFTHWLDYRLWPDAPVLMHAQSIVWYGAVVFLVALLFRQLQAPGWAAGLAALLFAVDDAHLLPVTWVANRNGLLAIFFGLLALIAHDRWRREGRWAGAFRGPFWLALAVLSAEAGAAAGAYLVAYALFLDRGTWRQRLGCLAPYVAVGVVWQVVHHYLGYGTWGSGLYVDPVREPLQLVVSVFERWPVLLLGQWGAPEVFVYNLLSAPARSIFWLVAVLFVVLVGIVMAPLIREDRLARFFALGMALAVLPVCVPSLTSGRQLLFVGIGGMGLVALFLGGMFAGADWLPARRVWRIPAWGLCVLLLGCHAIYAPMQLILGSSRPSLTQSAIERLTDVGPVSDGQNVVVVNAPCVFFFAFLPSLRSLHQQSIPAHTRVLSPGYFSVEVSRVDDNTLAVRPEKGYLQPSGTVPEGREAPHAHPVYAYQAFDATFRGKGYPMALGQRVELTGMQAEVTALTDDERPSEARIRFDRPLEDASFKWLKWDWKKGGYVRFIPPAVGETVRVFGAF